MPQRWQCFHMPLTLNMNRKQHTVLHNASQPRPTAMGLPSEKTTTNSKSGCTDTLQVQENISSGTINKHNWSAFNMMCALQMKAGSVHMQKQANDSQAEVSSLLEANGCRISVPFDNSPPQGLFWSNCVTTCPKTECSKRISVDELKIHFNDKQLHSILLSSDTFFPPFSFLETGFLNFQSFLCGGICTHVIEKMFVQWYAWEYSYLILMIKPRGQKIISRNLLLFIKKKRS